MEDNRALLANVVDRLTGRMGILIGYPVARGDGTGAVGTVFRNFPAPPVVVPTGG